MYVKYRIFSQNKVEKEKMEKQRLIYTVYLLIICDKCPY